MCMASVFLLLIQGVNDLVDVGFCWFGFLEGLFDLGLLIRFLWISDGCVLDLILVF